MPGPEREGEYLYIDLPTKNLHDNLSTSSSNTFNLRSAAHILRGGLNYHFN